MLAKSLSSGKPHSSQWVALHVHYNDNLDTLLKKCIKPLFKKLLEGQDLQRQNFQKHSLAPCERLFFIRYKARGPHLRLRFLPKETANQDAFLDSIIHILENYIKRFPSQAKTPSWALELPGPQAWLSMDQILIEPYQRETIRYGGALSLAVSEQQFMASSLAVLSALDSCLNKDKDSYYQYVLGIALQMHLGFLFSLELSLYQSALLMDYFKSQWIDHSYLMHQTTEHYPSDHKIHQQRSNTMDKFMVQFNQQKEMLLATHQSIWQGLVDGNEITEKWYAQWIKNMRRVSHQLNDLWREQKIAPTIAAKAVPSPFRLTDEQATLWPIYSSYIHMTNNRLGIANHDEAYLAYMMARSLKCLAFNDTRA